MISRKKFRFFLAIGWSLVLGFYLGIRFGESTTLTKVYIQDDPKQHLPLIAQETFGLITFHGDLGQDRWVLGEVFPEAAEGFFVDVGSADGTHMSNSKTLEAFGWSGICIDPFPTNMEDRTCKLAKKVVYSTSGETVSFRAAGVFGGIDSHIDKLREVVKEREVVEFSTVTLGQLLDELSAPPYIHYLSLDIEGAELEALKGFPFDRYTVGAITVEHLYEEPRRSQVRLFLEKRGFRLEKSAFHEDWYVHHDIPEKPWR